MAYSMRIPTAFNTEEFNRLSERSIFQMNAANQGIANGYSAYSWSEAPERTRSALTSSCSLLRTQFELQQAAESNSAMTQRDNVYKQMKEILTQFKVLCIGANNTANTAYESSLIGAGGMEKQFVQCLNTQDASGNYLFSGSAWNIRPVDMAKYTQNPNLAVPNVEYYQGNLEGAWPTAAAPFSEQALRAFQMIQVVMSELITPPQGNPQFTIDEVQKLVDEAFNNLSFDASLSLGSRAQELELEVEWLQNIQLQSAGVYEASAKTSLIKAVPEEIALQQQSSLSMTALGGNLSQMTMYAKQLLAS